MKKIKEEVKARGRGEKTDKGGRKEKKWVWEETREWQKEQINTTIDNVHYTNLFYKKTFLYRFLKDSLQPSDLRPVMICWPLAKRITTAINQIKNRSERGEGERESCLERDRVWETQTRCIKRNKSHENIYGFSSICAHFPKSKTLFYNP